MENNTFSALFLGDAGILVGKPKILEISAELKSVSVLRIYVRVKSSLGSLNRNIVEKSRISSRIPKRIRN